MKIVVHLCAGLWAGVLFAADPAAPTELTADAVYRDRFTARWTNAAATVSNKLEVIKVFPRELEANFVTNYTFDAISNSGGSVAQLTAEEWASLAPDFSGDNIRKIPHSTGMVQIGLSDKAGCLEFAGLPSYEGLSLIISAQKMADTKKETGMLIEFATAGVTNRLTTLSITNTMEHYVVPLNDLAGGARLLFHSTTQSDPRVLIDSIGFATAYTLPYSQTNEVASAVFPARSRYRVRDLEPQTRYLWRVGGWTADAAFLGFSAYATVETTDDAAPVAPLVIRLR